MKNIVRISIYVLCIVIFIPAHAQIGVLKRVKERTEERTGNEVDKKVDEGLDKIFGGKKEEESPATKTPDLTAPPSGTASGESSVTAAGDVAKTGVLSWAKYDFIPGDEVIFEDNLEGEENGEFPSRWDLSRGVVEVAQLDGENVIMFRGGSPTIIPYLENSDRDYLPDVFTIEFDMYLGGATGWADMFLWDNKNQDRPSGNQYALELRHDGLEIYGSESNYPDDNVQRNRWIHIAVAYTNGQFKAYMDDTRLINIPRLDVNPSGISLYSYHASDDYPVYFKNIRIAEGGVKYYDRVLQDGKIVANGIRFDVGKATLRPESMGVINEVVDLMNEHPDLKFSVEGHTDSDGNDELNMTLSQERAETVRATMIGLGIAEDRLQAKGLGETMPVSDNTTAEGKANNRRVEFVKF
jgi:outer membrane protein OmpA-like peptidoglycan-associated protein